jgi:hypothetical protein
MKRMMMKKKIPTGWVPGEVRNPEALCEKASELLPGWYLTVMSDKILV